MSEKETIVQIKNVKRPGYKKKITNAIISVILFILLIIISFIFLYPKNRKYTLEDFDKATVNLSDLDNTISLTGVIGLKKSINLFSPETTFCKQVLKKSGDSIKEGELLIILDSSTLLLERDSILDELKKVEREVLKNDIVYKRDKRVIESNISKLQRANLRAKKNMDKIHELYKLGSATLQEYETAQDEFLELKEGYNEAKESLINLDEDLKAQNFLIEYDQNNLNEKLKRKEKEIEKLSIKSPISGTVISINIKEGELINSNILLASVGDLNTPYIELEIPEKNRQYINNNQSLNIKVDKKVYKGKLFQIDASALITSKGNAVVKAKADFIEAPSNIIPGSQCGAELIISSVEDCLTLPRGTYIVSGKDRYLFRISEDGKMAKRIKVQYGNMNSSLVSIKDGVEIGDEIVISSYSDFVDNEEIYLKTN